MDTIDKARWFATWHHRYDKYGVHPYFYHLGLVESVLREFNITSENLLAAAWLHDVVEDTGISNQIIVSEFGATIGFLVDCVTGEGETRKERNKSIYKKTFQRSAATALKLADRIANVRNCKRACTLYQMYKREYPEFRKALYCKTPYGPLTQMWDTLDELMEYT